MDEVDWMHLTNTNDPGALKESIFRWRTWYADAINQLAEARLTIKEQRNRIRELERLVERITGHAPAEYESIIRDMEGTNNG